MPVADYLNKMSKTDRMQYLDALADIKALAQRGSMLGLPYVKKLQGEIWELRPKSTRILYCTVKGKTIYLLHAFMKKSNKTPLKELKTAQDRYKLLQKSL